MALVAPRPSDVKKSNSQLWRAVSALLVFFLFLAFEKARQAASEKDTARRQEISFGDVVDCGYVGKGGQWCHYVFQTGEGRFYTGGSWSLSDIAGRTLDVYYDTQNPRISALESFSVKSYDDQIWVYIYLIIASASIGVGLYAQERSYSDRQSL